jgi:hypothetical protein
MEQVKVSTLENGRIAVKSPFHPTFPAKARAIGGKWDGGTRRWTFDARDEERARALCMEIFGTDGTPQATATVQIVVEQAWRAVGREYWRFGRRLINKMGRDSTPSLGDGVILVDGAFLSRGGSRANPIITMRGESVTLEVRDVPRAALEADDGEYTIVEEQSIETISVTLPVSAIAELRADLRQPDAEIVKLALAWYATARKATEASDSLCDLCKEHDCAAYDYDKSIAECADFRP